MNNFFDNKKNLDLTLFGLNLTIVFSFLIYCMMWVLIFVGLIYYTDTTPAYWKYLFMYLLTAILARSIGELARKHSDYLIKKYDWKDGDAA